ncbi:MAG: DUF4268 domain-containing protein [Pseudomonadota bacterium]
MKFGKVTKLNLREIWPKESSDFTPWLAENISALGEALGMELEIEGQEASVGDFSLDLLAKDLGSGHTVVIENQLCQTDHDHLGKLLTYAAGFSASTVIWVSETVRDEHRQALEWLNQRTDEDTQFFGVAIEVFKIDDSKPAYSFNPVVYPNEWQKSKKRQPNPNVSSKGEAYRNYFQSLIDELREKYHFTNAKKAQPQNWYSFSSGFSNIPIGAVFNMGQKTRTELYIDVLDKDRNKAIFDWLVGQKESIQDKFDQPLDWERLDDKRASRIAIYREGSIESSEEDLLQIKNWHIENLLKFKKIFIPLLKKGLKEINVKS